MGKLISSALLPFILILSVILIVYCEWDECKTGYDKFLLVVIVILVANVAIKYLASENVVEGFRSSCRRNNAFTSGCDSSRRGDPFITGIVEDVEEFTNNMDSNSDNSDSNDNEDTNENTSLETRMSIDNKFNSLLKNSALDKAVKSKNKNSFGDVPATSTTTTVANTNANTTTTTTTPTPTQEKVTVTSDELDLNRMLGDGNADTDKAWIESTQKNARGITSIFRPQIIIKDEKDKTGIYYKEKSEDKEKELVSYNRNRNRNRKYNNGVSQLGDGYNYSYDNTESSSVLNTQEPTHNIWSTNEDGSENTRPDYVLGDPYQNYSTPSQQLAINSYNILPASCKWDVPQQRPSACIASNPIANPVGVGNFAPLVNMLELNSDGTQAASESRVRFTNIGSVMPKFNFAEVGYNE
jgi:hypothetical protein